MVPTVHHDYGDLGMSHQILGATWPFTIIAIIVLGVRLYVRRRFAKRWSVDDWIMVAALVFQIVFQVFLTLSCVNGLGKATPNLTPNEQIQSMKWDFFAEGLGNWVSMLARVSIAIMLVRIFGASHPLFKWYVIVFTIIQVIIGILGFIFGWIQRVPIQSLWDPDYTLLYRPVSRETEEYTNMTFQFLLGISDFTFVLFPVIFICRLTMPMRQKVGIALLLSTSIITFAAALVKIVIVVLGLRKQLSNTTIQYVAALVLLTTSIEQALVIAIGCVPALAPVTKMKFPRLSAIGDTLVAILPGSSRRSKKSHNSDSASSRNIEMTSKNSDDMKIRVHRPARRTDPYDITELHTTRNTTVASVSRAEV